MSATTPLWVPLAVAAGGLATTLGAAVMTQWWATRREEVRWRRERADRREQWGREDSLRWLQDRQRAYARFVAALDDWDALDMPFRLKRGYSRNFEQKNVFTKGEIENLRRAAAENLVTEPFSS